MRRINISTIHLKYQKKDLLKVSEDHLYLEVGYFAVQSYELFIGEHYIGGVGDYNNGKSDVTRYTSIFNIPIKLLEENNTFEFRSRSVINTGIKGKVTFLNQEDMLSSKAFIAFDSMLTLFVIFFGTTLLSIVLIYLSATMIMVRNRQHGWSHIWLSIAVLFFLSLNYMGSYGEIFFLCCHLKWFID